MFLYDKIFGACNLGYVNQNFEGVVIWEETWCPFLHRLELVKQLESDGDLDQAWQLQDINLYGLNIKL